jgi:hypothetical protein
MEGSLKATGVDNIHASAEFNAMVVQLAKRTQMVMFLREAMYRLCEQSLNNRFDKEDILLTYTKILDAATQIVETDHAEAATRATEAIKALEDQRNKQQQ